MTVATTPRMTRKPRSRKDFKIALPPSDLSLSQDEEWCVVRVNDKWCEIRLHDYDQIFSVPGLYERLIYDILGCDSPARIRRLLWSEIEANGFKPDRLRVLDLGAGNGMVGEELVNIGAKLVVGVDIIDSAADATERDRPGIYEKYHTLDMTKPREIADARLADFEFNCLTCVAALGFGDIPSRAFANAFNLVADGGWIAFNIKSTFLGKEDQSGFSRMIRAMMADGTLEVGVSERYDHRVGTDRQPIEYTAIIGTKHRDIAVDTLD